MGTEVMISLSTVRPIYLYIDRLLGSDNNVVYTFQLGVRIISWCYYCF